jgi:hypothetical protein
LTNGSLARPAPKPFPSEVLLDRIELEIGRLQEKRPALDARIDRAANILVTHLACPRQRVIRVRLRGGHARFLVNGSGGGVYVVDPLSWSCSCPDFHRADLGACKHSICCFILWRVSRLARGLQFCHSCGEKFPSRELTEVQEAHESLIWFPGDRLCDGCIAAHGGIA